MAKKIQLTEENKMKLAKEFSAIIKRDLTEEQLSSVIRTNREENHSNGCCATHDFLDANMSMDEAFQNVFKREYDFESDEDTAIENHSWAIAKKNHFFHS